MINITIYDIIGNIGVFLIVIAYLFINSKKWKSDDTIYLVTNLFGSIFITISLFHTFNLASFIIEMFWISITLYGFYKKWNFSIDHSPKSSYVEV